VKYLLGVLTLAAAFAITPAVARAQPPDPANPTITPAELQRLFDSWALLQAQEFLKIPDDQYARFLPRFKALQDARRQTQQQHLRVLNMLRKSVNDGDGDEQIKAGLKQLQEIDDRGAAEARRAQDAVDSVLDVPQQARFRIFEEQMERRKLELVTRARQAGRANNPNRGR
jgi:hypothetical protein